MPSPFSFLTALGKRRSRAIGVREAWLNPDRYSGQVVSLIGVVRAFDLDTPAPYFTLDDGPQRIGLRADQSILAGFTRQAVRATGKLTFKPGIGIYLEVEEIAASRAR